MHYIPCSESQIHLEDFDPPWKLVRSKIKQKFGGVCAYCAAPSLSLTLDHVVPKSKGGPTTWYNLIPACYECNQSKSNHDLSTWYREQPFWDPGRETKILQEYTEGHHHRYGIDLRESA